MMSADAIIGLVIGVPAVLGLIAWCMEDVQRRRRRREEEAERAATRRRAFYEYEARLFRERAQALENSRDIRESRPTRTIPTSYGFAPVPFSFWNTPTEEERKQDTLDMMYPNLTKRRNEKC